MVQFFYMSDISRFFLQCTLFKNLSSQERSIIHQSYPWNTTLFQKNAFAGFPGDDLTHFRAVLEGSLAAEIMDDRGNTVLIETLDQGALIAGPLLFSSQPILPVQLRALEPTSLLTMSKPSFLKLLASHPRVMEALLTESADKIAFLAEKIRLLQFNTLEEKLIHWFKRQAKLQNPQQNSPTSPLQVRLPFTQDTLASLFGVTRPALSRCLGEMGERGNLTRISRGIYLIPGKLMD